MSSPLPAGSCGTQAARAASSAAPSMSVCRCRCLTLMLGPLHCRCSTVELYDAHQDSWGPGPQMPAPLGFAAVRASGCHCSRRWRGGAHCLQPPHSAGLCCSPCWFFHLGWVPCRAPCWAGTPSWSRAPRTRRTCSRSTASAAAGRSAPRCGRRASTWQRLRWRAGCLSWCVPYPPCIALPTLLCTAACTPSQW